MTDEEFYRVLADVTAAVTESLVLETALAALGDVVVPRLADWCAIHLAEGDRIELAALAHADAARIATARELDERYGPSVGDDHGVARVLRTGVAELHETVADRDLSAAARDAVHLAALESLDIHAAALVPLARRGRVLGVLTLMATGERRFDAKTLLLAEDIARRAAVAIENAQLFTATERARAELSVTHGTLTRLLQLSPVLSFAEDEVRAAATAAGAARELFDGDAASVWRFDGSHIELVARLPEQAHLVAGHRLDLANFPGFEDEMSIGRPSFVPDLAVLHPELSELATTVRSLLRLPLLTSEGPAGFITVSWSTPHEEPRSALLALGQRFADLAALAMEDARRRRAESDRRLLHLQLEASLMPTPRVTDRRLSVRSRYVSGEQGLMLAGDFLDAYELPDGTVRAIIGDVVGHGPEAAARAASLRSGWRALTAIGLPQVDVIAALEQLVLDDGEPDEFVTVCAVEVAASDDALSVVSAGHPLPIVVGPPASELVAETAPPLGLGAAARLRVTEFCLGSEWTVLLYTDGLIEGRAAPGQAERFGVTRLLDWLGGHAPRGLEDRELDALLHHVRAAHGATFADDTAVLVLTPPRRERRLLEAAGGRSADQAAGGTGVTPPGM
jgi:serine phosphatase RsbU (regulator of sigma subunit)